jgi:hypothetical protein
MKMRSVRGPWTKRLPGVAGGRVAAVALGWVIVTLSPVAAAQSAGGAAPARAASAAAPTAAALRAASELRVIEDDQVRIEETRVRGQVQRITVAPKGSPGSAMRPYEINVGAGGRDPSQDKSSAGQRVWSVLRF